eukprot:CAMPEP_0183484828 /NCGR_PEP_ID=MMETSP0370-20130417/179117_1 /TAXON_ID=268820 /ORGANISM="Peridinium aciculiferum, Strain PAER-2" /LENGTH=226 /DNA_ID=CAMNT_0025678121 /DNA_START=48 /DNA_END=730 /DNA_ORIENTATION=-
MISLRSHDDNSVLLCGTPMSLLSVSAQCGLHEVCCARLCRDGRFAEDWQRQYRKLRYKVDCSSEWLFALVVTRCQGSQPRTETATQIACMGSARGHEILTLLLGTAVATGAKPRSAAMKGFEGPPAVTAGGAMVSLTLNDNAVLLCAAQSHSLSVCTAVATKSSAQDGAATLVERARPSDLQRTGNDNIASYVTRWIARVNGGLHLWLHDVKARSLEPKRLRKSHA